MPNPGQDSGRRDIATPCRGLMAPFSFDLVQSQQMGENARRAWGVHFQETQTANKLFPIFPSFTIQMSQDADHSSAKLLHLETDHRDISNNTKDGEQ